VDTRLLTRFADFRHLVDTSRTQASTNKS